MGMMAARNFHELPTSDDPTMVLAHCPAAVGGFAVTVLPIPGRGDAAHDFHPTARIFVAQCGRGRRWYTRAGSTRELHTSPRMVELYEAGLGFDRSRWEGEAGRCVMVEFGDAEVQAATHGALPSLALRTQHEVFDARVSSLTLALAQEVLFGEPQGQLYVQGLSLALLGVLMQRHTHAPAPAEPAPRQLSPPQRRRVVDLVAARYGEKLSLPQLAAQLQLSPQHFARLFKASFGVTPHVYVQQVRLEAAVSALRHGTHASIADVALACGFSGHSHLSDLLRRHHGVTPSTLRSLGNS
jgi:AraC family transcriptional regulator